MLPIMDDEISPRARTLLDYFWQVATDPRVRGAATADAIFDAVVACARDDWSSAWGVIKRNGRRVAPKVAEAVGGHLARGLIGQALDWLESDSGGSARRRR